MKAPLLLRLAFPSVLWHKSRKSKVIYLTFDDGPVPDITPWVLDTLAQYNAKASFFCIGDNVKKHPGIYHDVLEAGHKAGNHTFHHLNGWKTDNETYYKDIEQCHDFVHSDLFRPPYGRMKLSQIRYLKTRYKLIMWDVVSRDYDRSLSPDKCLRSVIRNSREGSVIVFHDSIKAEKNLKIALPGVLKYFSEKGYTFASL